MARKTSNQKRIIQLSLGEIHTSQRRNSFVKVNKTELEITEAIRKSPQWLTDHLTAITPPFGGSVAAIAPWNKIRRRKLLCGVRYSEDAARKAAKKQPASSLREAA